MFTNRFQGSTSFCEAFVLFMSCVCHAFTSLHCCLVVIWKERTDLLALVCDVYFDFVTFPFGILGQVWYLFLVLFAMSNCYTVTFPLVSLVKCGAIPDPCCLFNFYMG